MSARVKPKALTRGTAVHLGGALVKFVWACGCTKVTTLKDPLRRNQSEETTALLVRNWRLHGVELDRCAKHPDHHDRKSPLLKLNAWHPQPTLENLRKALGQQPYQHRYITSMNLREMLDTLRHATDEVSEEEREIFMANVLRVASHLLRQVERTGSASDAYTLFWKRLEKACEETQQCVLYLDARITGVPMPCDDLNKERRELPSFLQRQAD